jgi:hypothetical protein
MPLNLHFKVERTISKFADLIIGGRIIIIINTQSLISIILIHSQVKALITPSIDAYAVFFSI